jgi:16S rRNA (guanine527-N7)-methyltransferase
MRDDVLAVCQELSTAGFEPDDTQRGLLSEYVQLITSRAGQINLVSARDIPRVAHRHVLESFNLLLWPVPLAGRRLVDVGSGAGFPGIPLAIWQTDLDVSLVESSERKAQFLEYTRKKLRLGDRVRVLRGRAADVACQSDVVESFDVVTARGLAPLSRALPWVTPFMKPGAHFVAFKGTSPDREIQEAMTAMTKCGLELVDVIQLRWGHGSLVVMRRGR